MGVGEAQEQLLAFGQPLATAAKKKRTPKGQGNGDWAKKRASMPSSGAGDTTKIKSIWQTDREWLGDGGLANNHWRATCAVCGSNFDSKSSVIDSHAACRGSAKGPVPHRLEASLSG